MPNSFAYFALLIFPFISIALYRKLDIVSATFWTILGGFLFLPVKTAIDLPFIPPLDKDLIPSISALFGLIVIKKVKVSLLPKSSFEQMLILIMVVLPFFTFITNTEPYFDGNSWRSGLTLYDALASTIAIYLQFLSFIIAIQLIKTYEDQLKLFKLIVVAGTLYSLLILIEIRLSPQLHTWIYGFFPHNWGQTRRFDGFRAIVFMGHGLTVAMFVAISLGAAAILWKNKINTLRIPAAIVLFYLFVVLILSKSVGAFLIGSFLLITITMVPIAIHKRAALVLMFIVLAYPLLSIMNLFPHAGMLELASSFDADRAQSLAYRFTHENAVLEHSQNKPLFGWGAWGRNRLSDSVIDGYWVQILSKSGFVGFVAFFGLATISIWKGSKTITLTQNKAEHSLLAAHTLICVLMMLDQIPNHSLYSWMLFYLGALSGRANYLLTHRK